MNQRSAIRIGVIADTHGRLDPVVRRHFKGVDYIKRRQDHSRLTRQQCEGELSE